MDPTEESKLREEIEELGEEAERRAEREKLVEELKNRVSIAAIILTTALSFIGNVKTNRDNAIADAKEAVNSAHQQAAELWAYYQTGMAERTSVELGYEHLRIDLKKRGISENDPQARLESMRLGEYQQRLRDFDAEATRIFYRVQDLEGEEDRARRSKRDPERSVVSYDLGGKLITLALILLSVTILSNRRWLFWGGVILGAIGIIVALNGYFLLT
jgi:hypothetical protein